MTVGKTGHVGTIVDRRRELPFIAVERVVLRAPGLSNNAKVVYLFLIDYAGRAGSCYPGQLQLSRDLQAKSVDTVQRALGELRRARLIDWKQQGRNRPNTYFLLPVQDSLVYERPAARTTHIRLDTAPVRHPDTAPMRSKQEPIEQEKKQQHSQYMESQGSPSADAARSTSVVAVLVEKGISARAAERLASRHTSALIQQKVQMLEDLQRRRSPSVTRNPAGWLRQAIEEGYAPPPGYLAERVRLATHQRREEERVKAEAGDLIRRAEELSVAPERRAKRALRLWEKARSSLMRPPVSAEERRARLRDLAERFTRDRDEFFAANPQLRQEGPTPVLWIVSQTPPRAEPLAPAEGHAADQRAREAA